jgi:ParB-like nuclease family protein
MDDNREFHPAAKLFPLLRGKAFQELVADIKNNGLLEPILVDAEGRILDGRNRYRACLEAKVEPRFVDWPGEGSPVDLALSLNLRRRHLNESQRAMVGARLAILEAEARQRKGLRSDLGANLHPGEFGKSCHRTAMLVNVSPRLVAYALKVVKEGCDQLIAAVEAGELAVSAASVLAGLPREEQAKAVAEGSRQAARKARELRGGKKAEPGPPPGWGFRVWKVTGPGVRENFDVNTVSVIWVPRERLPAALQALRERGFQDLAKAGSAPTPEPAEPTPCSAEFGSPPETASPVVP